MCGIELDGRMSIVLDLGRYIIGDPTTSIGMHSYVWLFMNMYGM